MSQTQNPITDVYCVFTGDINQANVEKLVRNLTTAAKAKVARVHMMFQSFGGFVGDGVFLYNFFRILPLELILYNCGTVQSIAAIAYLGAHKRKVSGSGTFMIHRSHVQPNRANADALRAVTDSLAIDDERTEAILRAHLNMTTDQWVVHQHGDLCINAKQSVAFKLADEISEFSLPSGATLVQIV